MATDLDFEQEFESITSGVSESNDFEQEFESIGERSIDPENIKAIGKSPLSVFERATQSFATEKGKEIELAQKFGRDNVLKRNDGEFIVKKADKDGNLVWHQVDPSGFKISDVIGDAADVVSYIPEIVMTSIGSVGGPISGLATGAVAGGLGEATRQAIGNVLGVRPDDTALENASEIAISGMLNGAFKGLPATKVVKSFKSNLGKGIGALNKKFNSSVVEPILQTLTKMKGVPLRRGIDNPTKVLTKSNMDNNAIGNLVNEFMKWQDDFTKTTKNKFSVGQSKIIANSKDTTVDPSSFRSSLKSLVDEFNAASSATQKLSKTDAKLIQNISDDISNKITKADLSRGFSKDSLSVSEAIKLKRAIAEKINPSAFQEGSVKDTIQRIQLNNLEKIDGAIKKALGPKEEAIFREINKDYSKYAKLRSKLVTQRSKERFDSTRNYIGKIATLENGGESYKVLGERQFLDSASKKMLGRIDDVFAAQEWAKKQPRLNGVLQNAAFASFGAGGLTAGATGSTAAGVAAGSAVMGGALTLRQLTKSNFLAKNLKAKEAVGDVIKKAISFKGNPAVVSNIIQQSRDEKGNKFNDQVKQFILQQVQNGVDDKEIREELIKDNLRSKLSLNK